MKKLVFAVLAVVMVALCSCDNETAVALNGAWRNDASTDVIAEYITFTKTNSNGGTLVEKFVVEDFNYDGTRYGFEVSMSGEWHMEDDHLFVTFDESSISSKRYDTEDIEELEELRAEIISNCRENARSFTESYRQKIYVDGFQMNSDTHFSWIDADNELMSFTKM